MRLWVICGRVATGSAMSVHKTPQKVTRSTKKSHQVRAFRKAARELGTDESEEAFNAALKEIAKAQRDPNEDFGSEAWKKRHKRKD